jgi:hypothetical protein
MDENAQRNRLSFFHRLFGWLFGLSGDWFFPGRRLCSLATTTSGEQYRREQQQDN